MYTNIMVPKTTPVVKKLIIINLAVWFVFVLVIQSFFSNKMGIYNLFGFVPSSIESFFFIWQFFTYMFIHSSSVFHILFNMLILWMFGSELEAVWKHRFFITYYLACGIGAAIFYFIGVKIYTLITGEINIMSIPVVGSSGAMFGLLLAYALMFGNRIVLFMFLFPMKVRNFTILIACVELVTMLRSGFGSPVANLAHLGGLLSGFIFLRLQVLNQKRGIFKKSFFRQKKHIKILS